MSSEAPVPRRPGTDPSSPSLAAGPSGTGPSDAGLSDTGPSDAGLSDTGPSDTGPSDTGPSDTRPSDTGPGGRLPGGRLRVDTDTVDAVRRLLLAEADRLDALADRAGQDRGRVGRCGGDPISGEAAAAFDTRIAALVARCRSLAARLRRSAESLERAGTAYDHTEQRITLALDPSGGSWPGDVGGPGRVRA